MSELIKFIFVSSYDSLIFIIVILGILVALVSSKTVFGKARKMIGGFSIIGLLYFLLAGQEIVGGIYHEYLCETEAGWKNYSQIKLPSEYWNEDGSPNFIDVDGNIDNKRIESWFVTNSVKEVYVENLIKLDKRSLRYKEKHTNILVGEKITFMRNYGWINEYTLARTRGEICENVLIRKNGKNVFKKQRDYEYKMFIKKIFTK